MKIEKVNENKLIITLDSDDLESKNIDASSFLHNSPETQDLFWDVMQEAEKQYGFNIDESIIRVDAHISNNGIYTLIVTKSSNKLDIHAKKSNEAKPNTIRLKRKENKNDLDLYIYTFDSFSSLINYSKVAGKDFKSSLYMLNNKFYLILGKQNAPILEFASLVQDSEIMISKLLEYGKVVYEYDAIKKLLEAYS